MVEHKCLAPWKGAIAGGLIVFIWSAVAWMALPFHDKTIKELPVAAASALTGSIPESGIYILHNDPEGQRAPTDPFIFLSYSTAGWGSMGPSMLLGLLVQMIGGYFWTWILGKIPGLTLKDSATYGAMFGLCVGVLGALPNTVWWKFPFSFTALYIVDAVIAWTLASMVIGKWCQASTCKVDLKKA